MHVMRGKSSAKMKDCNQTINQKSLRSKLLLSLMLFFFFFFCISAPRRCHHAEWWSGFFAFFNSRSTNNAFLQYVRTFCVVNTNERHQPGKTTIPKISQERGYVPHMEQKDGDSHVSFQNTPNQSLPILGL